MEMQMKYQVLIRRLKMVLMKVSGDEQSESKTLTMPTMAGATVAASTVDMCSLLTIGRMMQMTLKQIQLAAPFRRWFYVDFYVEYFVRRNRQRENLLFKLKGDANLVMRLERANEDENKCIRDVPCRDCREGQSNLMCLCKW